MKIAVTGAGGLLGSAIASSLAHAGHDVLRLVRRAPRPGGGEIRWDPDAGTIDPELGGVVAAIHLAGESIAARRWTDATRSRIRGSRVRGTRLLAETLAALAPRPRVLISASAVGYYGDRGATLLDETCGRGSGFLAEVAEAWERAADPARKAGIRVVHLRIGVVLARRGGALAQLLPPFRLGLGGRLGGGRQYWSWIALGDLVEVVNHLLDRDDLDGPVNAVTPRPVTNSEFATTLARVLGRPAVLPVPAPVLRLMLGAMADEMLLASTRAIPARLTSSGFVFRHPELDGALRHELGRPSRRDAARPD